MKTLKTYLIPLAAMAFAACSESIESNGPASGNAISFNATQEQTTRTEYAAATNSYIINWITGDKVSVYAPTNETGNAVTGTYTVTPGSPANTGSLAYGDEGVNIKWGEQDKEHIFYAAYGKKVEWVNDNGDIYAKCQFIKDQNITATKSGNDYTAPADMTCAYMMCKSQGYTPEQMQEKSVELPFKPIMTTLQITLKGPATSGSSVTFKTIGITIPKESDVTFTETDGNTYFKYKADGDNTHTAVEAATKEPQSVSLNLPSSIKLLSGETLTVTAILPPIDISSTNKIQISIVSQDGSSRAMFGETVGSGKKAKIVCAEFKAAKYSEETDTPSNIKEESDNDDTEDTSEPTNWNDWQSYLPDNALVCSVTLPGSNMSGTYSDHAMMNNRGHHYQVRNIKNQLAQGVRVFDFNPIRTRVQVGAGEIYIVETDGIPGEVAKVGNSMGKASWRVWNSTLNDTNNFPQVFSEYLDAHPSEFCIVFINAFEGETETIIPLSKKEYTAHAMYTLLAANPGWRSYQWGDKTQNDTDPTVVKPGKLIKFRPDLTVGECRGKIIVISRNDFLDDGSKEVRNENGDKKTLTFDLSKSIVKCKWQKESVLYNKINTIDITENTSAASKIGTLVYQNGNANAETSNNWTLQDKKDAIITVAMHSKENHNGAKDNIWYLNNAAGDYGERADGSIRNNCTHFNPYMTELAKADTVTYPLGMVLINRTNQSKRGTTTLGGPALVNALIGLNFKDGVLRYKP